MKGWLHGIGWVVWAAWMVLGPCHASAPAPVAEAIEEDGSRFTRVAAATFRWRGWMAIYDVNLGLGPGVGRDKPLEGGPVRMEFTYHRAFTAKEIVEGGNALLAKNVPPEEMEALRPRLEKLNRAYAAVRPGDRYTLTHVPGRGLTLRLNGNALVTVEGDDFGPRYLRIWLGQEPLHKGLRDRLLGAEK